MKETIEFIPNEKQEKIKNDLLEKGYQYQCLKCGFFYKEKPQEAYVHGHINMCNCGCDLFRNISEIKCIKIKVFSVAGKIILKQHNFKYCKCEKGELWTGDAETECSPCFQDIKRFKKGSTALCPISGLKLVCLKSTQEELNNAGYLRYF